ncbi:hypothetical protein DFH06DRAFT_1154989 [Mycena polygramma]|nr:hypothetical protein DFH06DRAFT_1154989 [Mycena polygramma]
MTSTLETGTCSRCKTKKIRCDGSNPCNACFILEATCEFDDRAKKIRPRFELRKGQACLACRQKKKRCDGQQPCQTCKYSRANIRCDYPNRTLVTLAPPKSPGKTTSHRAATAFSEDSPIRSEIQFTSSGSSGSSAASDFPPEPSSAGFLTSLDQNLLPDQPLAGVHNQSRSTLDSIANSLPVDYAILSRTPQTRELLVSSGDQNELNISDIPLSSLVDDPHDRIPSLPRQKSHTLFEIESPNHEELLGIRHLFLQQRFQLGLSVPDTTLAVFAHAIHDGSALHPAVLHACQLLGYTFAHHLDHKSWCCQTEAATRQVRLALHDLPHPGAGTASRPVACLQAINLLSLYHFYVGDIAQARGLICRGSRYVRDHNLDCVAPAETQRTTFVIAPTTEAEETNAAVAQLVYLDIAYAVVLKLPSIIDPVLHANFKNRVLSRATCNLNTEMNSVRAKSVFLLFEALQLAVRWYQHPGLLDAEEAAEWQQSYWDLMEALDAERSFLNLTLTRIAFAPALRTLGISLKVCVVLVLTGLDALFALFSCGNEELQQKRHTVLAEFTSMGRLLDQKDCDNLDPLLMSYWTQIVGTLDQYMASRPESVDDISVMARLLRESNNSLCCGPSIKSLLGTTTTGRAGYVVSHS